MLDCRRVCLGYHTNPLHTTGPNADVESDQKQLQPADRRCCESTSSLSPMPQCNFHKQCRPPDAHEHCTPQIKALTDSAHAQLHAYSKQNCCLQHACLRQPGENTVVCCQLTEHASTSGDAEEEEAFTLEYQPVTNQQLSAGQGVCTRDSSKDAATSASITSSSSVSKTCHKQTLTGCRERVWHNKRHRRDGVMDLWTRKGLQLHCKATK